MTFRKRLDFSRLQRDWRVVKVAVDWQGDPLVLVEEGKPPEPRGNISMEQRVAWLNSRPKAHHLIYWEAGSDIVVTFEKSTGILSNHIQPFEGGWLLCDVRGGRAVAYDHAGRSGMVLDLGDASNDVQTTRGGKIWVSYFDEGVYGRGIGSQNGLVCFDASGTPIFKYFDFAKQHSLPFIDDCYALNVVDDEEIWISYYSHFPLVSIRRFQLGKIWNEFSCISHAFGILKDSVIFPKCYSGTSGTPPQLIRRSLISIRNSEVIEPIDEVGVVIEGPYSAAAKGPYFYIWTERGLYQMEPALDASAR